MSSHFINGLLLSFVFVLASCVSGVTVTKVTSTNRNPKGLRVNLPAPFLVGRPNPANEIDWKIEYFPDPDEEYAVNAWSLLAKNVADFTRTESGVLTKATLDMDTSAVASQLAKSAGAVTGASLDAATTQKTAAIKEQKDRSTALEANKVKLEQAKVRSTGALAEANEAKTKVTEAQTALDTAITGDNEETIKEAKTKLAAAQATHEKAEKAWRDAQVEVGVAQAAVNASQNSFDTGAETIKKLESPAYTPTKRAPSPVIYRIAADEATGAIKLVPVKFEVFSLNGQALSGPSRQVKVETWGTKKAKEEK